ncbi:MAG TPA: homocysteine S-methyltransferase family protein [Solirubrobacter sp.]|nr:homocysteine S-methyltransferase family protein [Solirubrobacter sp.]
MTDIRDRPGSPQRSAGLGYQRITDALAAGRCVMLDGGVATELPGAGLDEPGWGTRALVDAPDAVLAVHRSYLEAGCDVISTDTWGLAGVAADLHWMDLGRRGIQLAREAVGDRECAVAFSLNGEVDAELGGETARLLSRMFADEPGPPDLILLETLSLLSPSLDRTVEELVGTGLPVWLSFRRCRHGLCGVFGQHWGGPEGDAFGRAARRFEQMGVAALAINCIPPDHVPGMVSYLRDFVDLPLGVYPNLGYYTDRGWRSDPGVGGAEYAELALSWREEGAQIIGGCCGVRPEHIAAARERLEGTRPGHRRPAIEPAANGKPSTPAPPWKDTRGRTLYPLPFPRLDVEPGVVAPSAPSFMAWRHLFREGVGAGRRCLDVGCGTGILGIQLALNHAAHVHCIDIDSRAVSNTLANAFRNDVSDRLTAAVVDLYPWVPEERYEVVVASLAQQPTDPFQSGTSHRRSDYWGRMLLDQLISKLPDALAPEGTAYVVQHSIVSQQHTAALLAAAGLEADVVDYAVFGPAEISAQVERVEALSDAFHLTVGDDAAMVAYLLEIRHAE